MTAAPARRSRVRWFVAAWLAIALVLAGVVAYHASAEPDGLERVAEDHGFDAAASDHALSGWPAADYQLRGIGDDRAAVGLAGVGGVLLTLALAAGTLTLLRSRRSE